MRDSKASGGLFSGPTVGGGGTASTPAAALPQTPRRRGLALSPAPCALPVRSHPAPRSRPMMRLLFRQRSRRRSSASPTSGGSPLRVLVVPQAPSISLYTSRTTTTTDTQRSSISRPSLRRSFGVCRVCPRSLDRVRRVRERGLLPIWCVDRPFLSLSTQRLYAPSPLILPSLPGAEYTRTVGLKPYTGDDSDQEDGEQGDAAEATSDDEEVRVKARGVEGRRTRVAWRRNRVAPSRVERGPSGDRAEAPRVEWGPGWSLNVPLPVHRTRRTIRRRRSAQREVRGRAASSSRQGREEVWGRSVADRE